MEFFPKIIAWFRRPNKSVLVQYVEAFLVILPIAFVIRTFLYGLYQVPSGSMEPTMLIGERFLADKLSVWFSSPKRGEIISFNDPTYKYSKNKGVELVERYLWLPWGPANWTKRVIAIPGDHIKGVINDEGHPEIYLNGKKLKESYINPYPLIYYIGSDGKFQHKTYDPKFSLENQPFYRFDSYSVLRAKQSLRANGVLNLVYPGTPYPRREDGSFPDVFDYKLKNDEYCCIGDNRLGSHDSRVWGPLKEKDIHGKIIFRLWSHDGSASFWITDLICHPIDFWKRMRWGRCMQRLG
ncbi:signal peptidase I [bacterium]|jgi:signal peptidase I|nr:signal peptidase I [bacterium]